jgi:hypothetical protein
MCRLLIDPTWSAYKCAGSDFAVTTQMLTRHCQQDDEEELEVSASNDDHTNYTKGDTKGDTDGSTEDKALATDKDSPEDPSPGRRRAPPTWKRMLKPSPRTKQPRTRMADTGD